MKNLDFSNVSAGELANSPDEAAVDMMQQIVSAVLEDGRVQFYDPNNALWSRLKHPLSHIRDELHLSICNTLGVDVRDDAYDYHVWYDLGEIQAGIYWDLDIELPKHTYIAVGKTRTEIMSALKKLR